MHDAPGAIGQAAQSVAGVLRQRQVDAIPGPKPNETEKAFTDRYTRARADADGAYYGRLLAIRRELQEDGLRMDAKAGVGLAPIMMPVAALTPGMSGELLQRFEIAEAAVPDEAQAGIAATLLEQPAAIKAYKADAATLWKAAHPSPRR